MASVSFARACCFCRQFSTSSALRRTSKSWATFFTSARSSPDSSGAGRVRISKMTSSSSLMFSRTWRSCSSSRLLENFTSSSNNSSMLRLPAL